MFKHLLTSAFVLAIQSAESEAFMRHQEIQNAIYHAISKQGENAPTPLDFSSINMKSKVDTMAVKRIPDGVKNGIGDFLRITADTADVSIIVQVKCYVNLFSTLSTVLLLKIIYLIPLSIL